jgi:membrane associated rhomboid family serine protease
MAFGTCPRPDMRQTAKTDEIPMDFPTPRPQREPMFHVPQCVVWLIGVIVVAHVARTLLPADASEDVLLRFGFTPMRYAPGIDGGGPFALAAPFIGHIFLHGGFFHLGMNCLWLLACGPIVARRYGGFAFAVFFVLCGIAGAATFLACDWGRPEMMIGASGAVSGLMAASVRMMPWPGKPWLGPDGPLVPLWSKPVLVFTLTWVVTNLIFGATGIGLGSGVQEIAWQAHLGGFAAGLLFSSLYEAMSRRRAV